MTVFGPCGRCGSGSSARFAGLFATRLVGVFALAVAVLAAGGCAGAGRGENPRVWGPLGPARPSEAARLYTLRNERGMVLRVSDLGATIVELHAPDRDGNFDDIVLGFDEPGKYLTDSPYFGAIAGRCANRIEDGRFTLDGETHQLSINNGPHHLHGGAVGFDKRLWEGELVDDPRGESVRFTLVSDAGDQGYPGTLHATVTYTLTDENTLVCEMEATADAPTLCSLAQHTYWNLGGHGSGTILDHELTLFADRYTPVDETLIPTGELALVRGTPFDFRDPKPIGEDLFEVGGDPVGYDHNFVVNGATNGAGNGGMNAGATLRPVARVYDPESGRMMILSADKPGVQFYSGNFLDGTVVGKDGCAYPQYGGLCLESQTFPNAINEPAWRSPILRPGETYRHTMVTAFSIDRRID